MDTVSRTQLIRRISRSTRIWPSFVREIVDTLLDEIGEELAAGNEVRFQGFGTMRPRVGEPRELTHPQSGEPYRSDPVVRVHLKVGARLKEKLRRASAESVAVRAVAGEKDRDGP